MKKQEIILIVMLLAASAVHAASYRILWLSTESITIGKVKCTKGSVFSEKSTIQWASSNQCMRVQNTSTKEQFTICRNAMGGGGNTISAFYIKRNRASTRDILTDEDEYEELSAKFSEAYFLDKEIVISIGVPYSKTTYILLHPNNKGALMAQRPDGSAPAITLKPSKSGKITIKEKMLLEQGIQLPQEGLSFRVTLVKDGESMVLGNNMIIKPVEY